METIITLDAHPRCRNPRCGKSRRKLDNGRTEGSRGLCLACVTRWRRANCPAEVPDPIPAALRIGPLDAAQRREEYASLRDRGFTMREARQAVWVAERAGQRYERAWRQSKQDHREETAA
jgi:hypothetical protein